MASNIKNLKIGPLGVGSPARQTLLFAPEVDVEAPAVEVKGVVYTKRWVVELLLDLAGYSPDRNLVDSFAVEPAVGEGAFLCEMAGRLVDSCRRQGRALTDCVSSLAAFDIDAGSVAKARSSVAETLTARGVPRGEAVRLSESWIRQDDYLRRSLSMPDADFVIGNPPYVRLEAIPEAMAGFYRSSFPTMCGRADLYVAFYEAALRGLKRQGVCAFICADRWMLNQYGAALRSLITSSFSVEVVLEMHEADAFEAEVSAYPAITVIRRGAQGPAVVAKAGAGVERAGPARLNAAIRSARHGEVEPIAGLSLTALNGWFASNDPWPCASPARLNLLRRLEATFPPLESENGATRVGIGVATGADKVFITRDKKLVEASRLIPLAMAQDTVSGTIAWSGHYLVDPWNGDGLVPLERYPRLQAYLGQHAELLRKRSTAQKNPHGWYRTIDRVAHALATRPKLYIPDIKSELNPVLDMGRTYPHHNLYFITSDSWDLEVLGGLLLSAIGQFFVESYGVRMRGGYLRFQAQYLRRIRVPAPSQIGELEQASLRAAFRSRDRDLATRVALRVYQVDPTELESSLER